MNDLIRLDQLKEEQEELLANLQKIQAEILEIARKSTDELNAKLIIEQIGLDKIQEYFSERDIDLKVLTIGHSEGTTYIKSQKGSRYFTVFLSGKPTTEDFIEEILSKIINSDPSYVWGEGGIL